MVCSHCGLPLVAEHLADRPDVLCAACRLDKLNLDFARVYGLYRGTLRHLVLRLKFGCRERLGGRLGELLGEVWQRNERYLELESPILVPVPLHHSRERERGFNQSILIAEGLRRFLLRSSQRKGPRVVPQVLLRAKATAPQTGLSVRARHSNVKGVFEVQRPEWVRGRVVVLVDDVMTTGATLSSCALALKSAGASQVLALAVARSTPQFPDTPAVENVDGKGPEWT